MKFLPENKKKTIILLSVIGVCVIASIYFIFFYGKSEVPEVTPQAGTSAATPPASGTPGGSTTPTGDGVAASGDTGPVVGKSQVLPYGSSLNTKILEQDSFKILKYFRPVEVLPEELGKPNPFE